MNKITILPADTYLVVNRTVLNDNDRKILTMLYQPIIGFLPVSLYFNLWSDLDKTEIMSITYTHHHLMSNMQLKLEEIIEAREKLEAVGLLKTYLKKDNVNSYVYQLYSPLSAAEFLTHPFLSVLLCSYVGQKEYERLISYFKLPKIDLDLYEDITTHFDSVFETIPSNNLTTLNSDLKTRKNNNMELNATIDFDLILTSMSKGLLNDKAFDKATKLLINNLSFLYKLDTLHMTNIIKGCTNENGCIDKLKLRTACRNYYQFENENQLPGLIYRSQPEGLRIKPQDDSKRTKIIYTFETLSPYDFLRAKYNGGNPTSRDVKLIEELMVGQALNPGVVNVLIDYVLRINNNKLSKNFIESIASHWKISNIKTVEEAMNQAEREYKKYQKTGSTTFKKATTKEKLPEWFDKDIKEDKLSVEEETEVKDLLKEFV